VQVGGWRLQHATATVAVAHLAGKTEVVAEQLARRIQVVCGQRGADARTGNAFTARADGSEGLHAKTVRVGKTLQQREIALTAIAEAEIVAHQQKTQAQRQQIIADEIIPRTTAPAILPMTKASGRMGAIRYSSRLLW